MRDEILNHVAQHGGNSVEALHREKRGAFFILNGAEGRRVINDKGVSSSSGSHFSSSRLPQPPPLGSLTSAVAQM